MESTIYLSRGPLGLILKTLKGIIDRGNRAFRVVKHTSPSATTAETEESGSEHRH